MISREEALNIRECNRGFLISYNYQTYMGGGMVSNFGSLKYMTLDTYPVELDLIERIKVQVSQEFNLNPNTVDVAIICVTMMNIKDFKEYTEGQ